MAGILSGSAQAAAVVRATAAPGNATRTVAASSSSSSSSSISSRSNVVSSCSGNGVARGSHAVSGGASRRDGGARAGFAAPRPAIADGPAAAAATTAAAAAAAAAGSQPRPRRNKQQADEFRTLAAQGHNLIPLFRRIFDDQLTPILAYRCLVKEDERDAPSFLLESVVGGTQTGRFSFLGSRPYMEVRLG